MNRIHRLVGIVLLLQGRRVVRAEDIAQHFGVSVRTAYRDLSALDQAGVPIAAETGVGYSLVEGYHLPPIIFTREEAAALFFSSALANRFTDDSMALGARSAMAKIRAVLPPEDQGFVERLERTTAVHVPAFERETAAGPALAGVRDALAAERLLRIRYHTSSHDTVNDRTVEPLALIFYGNAWHMVGYCRLREDVRDFRVDRIRSIEILSEGPTERRPFSIRDYVARLSPAERPHEVRARFTKQAARFTSQKHYHGLVEQATVDDHVMMTFMVASLEWMVPWLLSFGTEVEVLAPDRLRAMVGSRAAAVAALYE